MIQKLLTRRPISRHDHAKISRKSQKKPSNGASVSQRLPANIRELQNVVERAVIGSEGDVLSIDESWFPQMPARLNRQRGTLSKLPPDREKKTIEAARAETRGRVSGPSGAARKLGIPSTTLERRIQSLKINKHRFNALDSLTVGLTSGSRPEFGRNRSGRIRS